MQMVKHKNVIALFEIYDEPKKMHLVMELVRGICVGRTSCLFVLRGGVGGGVGRGAGMCSQVDKSQGPKEGRRRACGREKIG
jgi:hypothetical protein